MIWTLLAFLIVFFILGKFAWPAIVKGLKERETGIADSLATAERVRAEMAQLKSENEALLVQAREERATMLKEARDTKDKIINEAKEQAKGIAEKIIADAQSAIERNKMAALIEVKNEIGILVVEISEKILRRELEDRTEQEKYIKQLAEEVKLINLNVHCNSTPRLAARYAKSLIDLSLEKGQLEQVYKDVLYLKSIFKNSKELVNFLNNPVITSDQKLKVVKAIDSENTGESYQIF